MSSLTWSGRSSCEPLKRAVDAAGDVEPAPRARVEDARQPPVRRKRAHDPPLPTSGVWYPHVERRQVHAVLIAVAGVDIRVVRIRVAGARLIEVVGGRRALALRQRVGAVEADAVRGPMPRGQLQAMILLPADVRVEVERADTGPT